MPIDKILLVDGATDERAQIARAFTSVDGPTILLADSGRQGLQLLHEQKPDVVLVNADLAGLDVAAFLAQVRQEQLKLPAITILLATVPPCEATMARYRDLGCTGVLVRPLALGQLPRQVQHLFEEGRLDAQLANLRELGGDEFVVEMIDLFLGLAPQQLDEARQALAAADIERVRRVAHSLKSSAANLGADAVQGLAAAIEERAAAQQAEALSAMLQELEDTFAQVRQQLEQRKAGHG